MNPRLVSCIFAAILTGAAAACLALVAGWGWLVAVATYSAAGSVALVGLALVVQPGVAPRQRPVRVASRARLRPVRASADPARS